MAKEGLKTWFKQNWVDIGSKRKDGSFAKCGRSKQKKDAKRKYPKCVPLAKARSMTEGQRRPAVARKRAAANVGPKPSKASGGRVGFDKGGSTGKIPTTPKEKKLAALAPPKNRITFGDVVTGRKQSGKTMARGGGLMEATERLRRQGLKKGGVARSCGAIMSNRRKFTKIY